MSKELFEKSNTDKSNNTLEQTTYNLIYENDVCVNSGNVCLVCKKIIDINKNEHICLFRKNTNKLIIK